MRWPTWWSPQPAPEEPKTTVTKTVASSVQDTLASLRETTASTQQPAPTPTTTPTSLRSALTSPPTLLATTVLTATLLTLATLYTRYAKRIPTAPDIPKAYFRRRSLFGTVTSVGDGDNFRLYHTPLGRWAGWSLFRFVPTDKKALSKRGTVHIRLAGVDAPEAAHFGRPAQPYSKEALDWLTEYVRGRRVRAYLHRPDQYGRVVATVHVWKFPGLRRDVGLQMIRAGLATVYDAKTGAEFGGEEMEKKYRVEEELAQKRKRGMWKADSWWRGGLERPAEYKARYRDGGGG